ncbi:hypothetical protein [Caballeronia sp. AZ10_KS36]|uniref:hypothetical protein n=1 Tax=Caballeronia sp. AZ10_KS36 TaxID=2921757 RepID=UPI0020291E3F|nr:hypothetical protein [Caballeronia sp. AZ10_KS36]
MMDVVHDILDKQLVDKNGVRMGRVDGLVAELRDGELPRLVFIETGTVVMARRFGRRAHRLMCALLTRIGAGHKTTPYRIAWKDVRKVAVDIELDVDSDDTPVHDWQRWLRERAIGRIPGAR